MSGSVIQQNFETMSSRVQKAEKIIGATDASGELTYLIKWKGNDNLELILAKEANLMCPQIVINFHQQRLTCNTEAGPSKVKRRFQKKIKSDLSSTINKIAEKIMSATDASGELTYLIKWEGNDNLEFISVEDANLICPQILIKFFEERLTWSGSNKNGV